VNARRKRIVVAAVALGVLLALVGGIALVASYWHARALAHAFRSPDQTIPDLSAWLPLTTDGLLAGAFAVIYVRRLKSMAVPRLAWAGAAVAGAGTVAANLATAHPSVTGWIVAGWAPMTFTLVDFLVAILIPPLVKAWRDAPDWPLPEPTAAMPRIATFPDDSPKLRESIERANALNDELSTEKPVPSLYSWAVPPISPDDDIDLTQVPFDEPGTRTTVPASVPAAQSRAVVSTRWTEDDERIRVEVQQRIDDGDPDIPWPVTARWMRAGYGMNDKRAARIIARLEARAS
jgi:hypothetical protein